MCNLLQSESKIILKNVCLVALTFQAAIVTLSTRHARTRVDKEELFFSSTAVVMAEVTKLVTCLVIVFYLKDQSAKNVCVALRTTIIENKVETLKICVPSLLYVIQNNLLYLAISHLDVVTYQVSFRLKILTTAIFAVVILQRKFTITQWSSFVLLIAGVSIIQLVDQKEALTVSLEQNRWLGFGAAFGGCILSGFTNIYMEKILKGANISVWLRNVQMSLLSIPIALIACFVNDFDKIEAKGFYHGYDGFVIYLILSKAWSGLLVAAVIMFADNILKGFASSLAIVISSIASIYLFDFHLTIPFTIGVLIILASIFLYAYTPRSKRAQGSNENIGQANI